MMGISKKEVLMNLFFSFLIILGFLLVNFEIVFLFCISFTSVSVFIICQLRAGKVTCFLVSFRYCVPKYLCQYFHFEFTSSAVRKEQ